jgi:hypothetical protein
MIQRGAIVVCSIMLLASGLGCQGSVDGASAHTRPYILSDNGLTLNGLVANGLKTNGLRMNGLRMNGLRMNGLRMNGFHINDLSEADSDTVMTYLVGCALPAGHSLTVYDVSGPDEVQYGPWYGTFGLGPQLEFDALSDPTQQRWVTACMLAHANSKTGFHVWISVRGGPVDNPIQTDPTELTDYTDLNGAFWGNLFSEPAELSACSPFVALIEQEVSYFTGYGRDCALLLGTPEGESTCSIEVSGACGDVCSAPTFDGSFPDCQAAHEVITVFLTPAPPPDDGFPPPPSSGGISGGG